MTISNTHPESIVDKNGKATTVHKKNDLAASAKRVGSAPAPSLAAHGINPLADYTPAEVDIPLAEIYGRISGEKRKIAGAESYIQSYQNTIESDQKRFGEREGYVNRYAEQYAPKIEQLNKDIEKYEANIEELREEAQPYQQEFRDRGGWSRFYQVTNSNGHVHTSTSCSTCYPTTEFYWHADRSGSTEEQIIDESGSDACTVCFPNAPVETLNRPGTLETPDRTAQREAREERERVKNEKARVAAEKAIFMPSGDPVLDEYNHPFKTDLAAERAASSARSNMFWYGSSHPSADKWQEIISNVTVALAHKRGTTVEEMEEVQYNKAVAKLKKDGYTPESIQKIRNDNGRP